MLSNNIFLYLFLGSFLAFGLAPIFVKIARKLNLLDYPYSAPHKQHSYPVPLAGGGIILGVLLIIMFFFSGPWEQELTKFLPSMLIVSIFGLIDDYKGLTAPVKLVGQLLAIYFIVAAGVQIRLFHLEWLNLLLTVLWIAGITNAFNLIDGSDGLTASLSILTSSFLLTSSILSNQTDLALLVAIVLGACIGFLVYNVPPAQVFLGDSGSQLLGFLLSILALYYAPKGYSPNSSWFVPILLFAIPIFDVCLVTFSRLRRGSPVYKGRLDHTFHRLRAILGTEGQAKMVIFLASFLISSLGLASLELNPLIGNAIFVSLLIVGIITFFYLEKKYKEMS